MKSSNRIVIATLVAVAVISSVSAMDCFKKRSKHNKDRRSTLPRTLAPIPCLASAAVRPRANTDPLVEIAERGDGPHLAACILSNNPPVAEGLKSAYANNHLRLMEEIDTHMKNNPEHYNGQRVVDIIGDNTAAIESTMPYRCVSPPLAARYYINQQQKERQKKPAAPFYQQ